MGGPAAWVSYGANAWILDDQAVMNVTLRSENEPSIVIHCCDSGVANADSVENTMMSWQVRWRDKWKSVVSHYQEVKTLVTDQEFYQKLFKALQQGTKKEEMSLVHHLCVTFGITHKRALPAAFVAAGIQPTDVFREVVTQIGPFAAMLQEIYQFLDQHRATTSGKADRFNLKFAGLNRKVTFNLDSFPKTFVNVLVQGRMETLTFNPFASDPVPGPNTRALDCVVDSDMFGSLTGLIGDSETVQVRQYLQENRVQLGTTYDQACTLVAACEAHLRRDGWQFFLPDPLLQQLPPDQQGWLSNGINLTLVYEFIAAWKDWQEGSVEASQFPGRGVHEQFLQNALQRFQQRFDALFARSQEDVTYWDRVIDDVIVPFWRNRWRLYEIWALVYTLKQTPPGVRTRPGLVPRRDEPGTFDWPIPYGAATAPVAKFDSGRGIPLEVWFQNLTPGKAGGGNIEPDIRIKTGLPACEDRFILELKDRFEFSAASAATVAQKYARGSAAMRVCVADYSPMKFRKGQSQLVTYRQQQVEILLVSEFHPGNPHPQVAEAILKTITEQLPALGYDLLIDVSGSAWSFDVPAQVNKLIAREGQPQRMFRVTTEICPFTGSPEELRHMKRGGTDIGDSLDSYFQGNHGAPAARVVLLTDGDGAAQLEPRWSDIVQLCQYEHEAERV